MKKFIPFLFLLTSCASFHLRVVGWYNDDTSVLNSRLVLSDGRVAGVVGNPYITCYSKRGVKLADGYLVRVENGYLMVDEFGKDFVYVQNGNGNYCVLNYTVVGDEAK